MKKLKLVYSTQFLDDFTEIVNYIKEDSPHAAKVFERNIRQKITHLKNFPEMGKVIDEPGLEGVLF